MPHVVKLLDIWRMLDECASGHQRKASTEYWTVKFNGKSYRSLPRGPHGRRVNPDIETGYVRSMIRHLGIGRECADAILDLT
jgi:hypothetical protein